MAKKLMAWKTKGMNRDLSVSAFNPEFAFENMNLRLSTNEGNTQMSWVNERGTSEITSITIDTTPWRDVDKIIENYLSGITIGTAVINDKLVLFTHKETGEGDNKEKEDRIYLLTYNSENESIDGIQLYIGDLHFRTSHPLETLVSYESEFIQKVYWTDGLNQPRIINIAKTDKEYTSSLSFDFVPELELNEDIAIKKIVGASGSFAPGVIQYVFTYYYKYGQETNIFYTSPLMYISYLDRGASPEDKVDNAFQITIKNVDAKFDYLRIYSIQRTSLNATPICKRIQDVNIRDNFYASSSVGRRVSSSMPTYSIDGETFHNIDLLVSGILYVEDLSLKLSSEIRWYGFQKSDFNNEYFTIRTSNGDIRFGEGSTENSVIWVSRDSILTEGDAFLVCETANVHSSHDTVNDYEDMYLVNPSADKEFTYIDTGFSGDTVDPTELLYKGGESIIAQTMEQKDNTLFFGNIEITREQIAAEDKLVISGNIAIGEDTRKIYPEQSLNDSYKYANQLTSFDSTGKRSVPCAGFKRGDYYRCGVQFQHKSGKWSEPIFLQDYPIANNASTEHLPDINDSNYWVGLPILKGAISESVASSMLAKDYMKARAVVVYPEMQDRKVFCQGVANPTVFTSDARDGKNLYAQASWFFRPYRTSNFVDGNDGTVTPFYSGTNEQLPYNFRKVGETSGEPESGVPEYNPNTPFSIRQVEVEGDFDSPNKFAVDNKFVTFHSPDLEFDDQMSVLDYINTKYRKVGSITVTKTLSDISIQTESPTVSSNGGGFVHQAFQKSENKGIVSGLFYDDYIVDDIGSDTISFGSLNLQKASAKWMVYPWNMTRSLNNDINRPSDKGTPTAVLKKKIISNLRYSTTEYKGEESPSDFKSNGIPQLFSSEEVSILKFGDDIYQGNIDTSLLPDNYDGLYFAWNGIEWDGIFWKYDQTPTPFTSNEWAKAFSKNPDTPDNNGIYVWGKAAADQWNYAIGEIGNNYIDLVVKKGAIRMKYKSTPHLAFGLKTDTDIFLDNNPEDKLPIIEVLNPKFNNAVGEPDTLFGGKSTDALRENTWIPCGEPVRLDSAPTTVYIKDGKIVSQETEGAVSTSVIQFEYSWGDTYYQRWDCLKTYAFTPEDINQVIEIGSFMLETHTNIDGRYDRNRGQRNNLNMSPRNFNLLNPVYSQLNNFFTYKIQDDDFYKDTKFSNQITWSKTKSSGAEIDLYTNVTLASILELDGDKGEVRALKRLNDQLLCFQDTGISQIMYNPNVQIASSQGVPIEIGNSGKVEGKRYLSDTIGCSNKWAMATAPSGIYFMDNLDKSIYLYNGQLNNITLSKGFNTWAKKTISNVGDSHKWTPSDRNNFAAFYDKVNQDILFVDEGTCLAFSEKFGLFTSFYSYNVDGVYLCNLPGAELWVTIDSNNNTQLFEHQKGSNYCDFFGTTKLVNGESVYRPNLKPYSMTLIGNPEPQIDKIFTNLEFRACVDNNGEQTNAGKFMFTLPFDSLETWNEYQHGTTALSQKSGHDLFKHGGSDSSLTRKFRIWRCDIPRDNYELLLVPNREDYETDEEYNEALEAYNAWSQGEIEKGISRKIRKPNDRMRNPWLYLKLQKSTGTNKKAEIHDMMMTYFT